MQALNVIRMLIFGALLPLTNIAYSEPIEKKIALTATDWHPYTGLELPNYGVASDIVTQAFEKVGYSVELTFMPWARILEEVKKGNYDGTAGAYWTKERTYSYLYSEPFMRSPVVFFKRVEDDIQWRQYMDLKPYKIGTVRGYANSPGFDSAEYLDKEIVNNDLFNLKKLIAGHIDLAIIDKFTARHLLLTKMSAFVNDVEPITPPLIIHDLYVMFSNKPENAKSHVAAFNKGMALLKADGSFERILIKHGFE